MLNRPHALNAVTHAMVRALAEQLAEWEDDPAVTRVVVTAAGERAFSAGGDLQRDLRSGRAGAYDEALTFWRDEYRLNALIKRYRKPYVALIDGVVMGGGVGDSHPRLASRRRRRASVLPCPRSASASFPDVGATWFLPRLPGELGTYCALTGERLDAADAARCRHCHASRAFGAVRGPSDGSLRRRAGRRDARGVRGAGGRGSCARQRPAIDRSFSANRVEDILAGARMQRPPRLGVRRPLPARCCGRDPDELADQPQDCACAASARPKARFRGVHADRIPHSVARRARA